MATEHHSTNIANEVLQEFWNLTDDDQDIQQAAIQSLITKSTKAQKSHSPTASDQEYSPLLTYCLIRLFKGLASDQTNLGIQYDNGADGVMQILEGLLTIRNVQNIQELCGMNISDLLLGCSNDVLNEIFVRSDLLQSIFKNPAHSSNPEDLFICLMMWSSIPDSLLEQCYLLPKKMKPSNTHWFNNTDATCSKISKALFQKTHLENISLLLMKTSLSYPRVHIVWGILLPLLLCNVEKFAYRKPQQEVRNFWKLIIISLSAGDTRQRHLSQSLSARIMQRLNASHIPMIIRGPYWADVMSAFHSEKHLMHVNAVACINQFEELAKQAPRERLDCFLPMMICRIPTTTKCRQFRQHGIEKLTPDMLKSYVEDLLHCLLKWPDASRKENLKIAEVVDFEHQEILNDLKTLIKYHQLSNSTKEMVFTVFISLTLIQMDTNSPFHQNRFLELTRKCHLELTEEIRSQCMSTLMTFCLLLAPSSSKRSLNMESLSSALDLLNSPGVHLVHESDEAVQKTKTVMHKLHEEFKCAGDEKTKRQEQSLQDLFSVLELYFLGNPESIDPTVFEDLLLIMHKFSGEAENSSNQDFIVDLMELLIHLSARTTDPYPIKLLTKFVRFVFLSFASELTMSSWPILLRALTKSDGFELEMDEDEMETDETTAVPSNPQGSSDEEETAMMEDMTDTVNEQEMMDEDEDEGMSKMRGFLKDVQFTERNDEGNEQENIEKKLYQDLNSMSVRMLHFIEAIIRIRPDGDFHFITGIYILEAMRDENEDRQQRFQKVLEASLKCKPKMDNSNFPHIREEISKFMKELPTNAELKVFVSKIFSFLVSRLMASHRDHNDSLAFAVEVAKLGIEQGFKKSSPVISPKSIKSILHQHGVICEALFSHLTEIGLEVKNPHQKVKLWEFLNTCLQEKNSESLKPIILSSKIGALFLADLEMLPENFGRVHLEWIQMLTKAFRSISKFVTTSLRQIVSMDQIATTISSKVEKAKSKKGQTKLKQLMELMKTL